MDTTMTSNVSNTAQMAVTVLARLGGLTKFGVTPGGGGSDGIFERSTPVGKEPILSVEEEQD